MYQLATIMYASATHAALSTGCKLHAACQRKRRELPDKHRHIQTTNAIENLWSLVRQRTDQLDVLYFGDQLSHHCLGDDPRYPVAQTFAGVRRDN